LEVRRVLVAHGDNNHAHESNSAVEHKGRAR
jgi:hypothetical protein